MVWSQSLVPVASVLLILGPGLLVLFLYYVETIWHLSVYLHVTLELDPKMWLLELGIQNSLSLTAVPLFIYLHDYPSSYEFSPLDGSTATPTGIGSAKKPEDLYLSSGENASFMVTAYLNYHVPCLNWLHLCTFSLQGPSCEILVMCMSCLTWSSRN